MLRCFSTTRHSIVQHAQRWPLALVRTNRKIHSKSAYHACCGVQSLRDRQGAAIRDASLRGFVDIISLRRTTSTTLRLRALGQKRGVRSCLRSISHKYYQNPDPHTDISADVDSPADSSKEPSIKASRCRLRYSHLRGDQKTSFPVGMRCL